MKDGADFEPLGEVAVKGVHFPISVYAPVEALSTAAARPIAAVPGLIGRFAPSPCENLTSQRAGPGGQTYGRLMRSTVRIDNNATRSQLVNLASQIQLIDQSLRENFSGSDVAAIVPEARRSLATVGLELSDAELFEYVGSISERQDFEFVIG